MALTNEVHSKICNNLAPPESTRLPTTPMGVGELLPLSDDEDITNFSMTLHQQKIGSLLFAPIATRLDIAFAVLRLSRLNQQPEKIMRPQIFCFTTCLGHRDTAFATEGKHETFLHLFVQPNASFGDNSLDRKGSQEYIMKLFGGREAVKRPQGDHSTA